MIIVDKLKYISTPILVILFAFSGLSCHSQSCNVLPAQFQSYNAAHTLITNVTFKIDETVDTRKSSWIRDARFKSCDGKVGFLVIQLKGKTYIPQSLPITV